jgi:hypothetical protein
MPRSLTLTDGIALAEGLCDLGEIVLAEDLLDWGGGLCPLFNYILTFTLQLSKITEASVSVAS